MIAIVGGGVAAASAAEALLELGYPGEISIFCSEDVAPYDRPSLSKDFLVADEPAGVPAPLLHRSGRALESVSLRLREEVVEVDADARLLTTSLGDELTFDKLLIATGSTPRTLDVPGSELDGVYYLRELTQARSLRQALRQAGQIVVIGGGVIGLEVAAGAVELGTRVTVIEAADQVMNRVLPVECARILEGEHTGKGVAIRTGTQPVAFAGAENQVEAVRLDTGESLSASAVFVGVGSEPRIGLAHRTGLTVDGGIVVDEYLRTSAPGIFAAGDAARVFNPDLRAHVRLEQWLPAQEQGRIAAANMLGNAEPYRGIPQMWSDQFGLHLQAVGYGFSGSQISQEGSLGERTGVTFLGTQAGNLVAACGISVGTGSAKAVKRARLQIEAGAE